MRLLVQNYEELLPRGRNVVNGGIWKVGDMTMRYHPAVTVLAPVAARPGFAGLARRGFDFGEEPFGFMTRSVFNPIE